MQKYFFNLICDGRKVSDPDGCVLANDAAAERHGVSVVRELLKRNEARKRHWLLEITDHEGQQLFEVPFDRLDETLPHLPPESRSLVQRMTRNRRELSRAILETRTTVLRTRATVARSKGRPYLVSDDGRQL